MTRSVQDFPTETFQARRDRILASIGDGAMVLPGADVRYSSRDTEYRYRPDSELFYATGLTEPDAVAVLRGHADDERFVLFVRSRDEEAELWHGPRPEPEEVGERVGADATHPLDRLRDLLPGLLAGADLVHFRLDSQPRCDALVRRALATARMRGPRKGEGPRGVVDPGVILDELRIRKEPAEIARMRRAAAITVQAQREALGHAGPGVGEWEVEAVLEGTFRALGADGPAYGSIVGSGPNACVLHYVANDRVMGPDDLVLVDAGAAVGLYAADVTRTFPVSGRYTPEQRAVYEIVEAAREAATGIVGPGVTVGEVHETAVGILVAGLLELGVLEGAPEEVRESEAYRKYFPHQTSHWLGLDVHDPGAYVVEDGGRVLEPGMVLTVEPGLYFRSGSEEEESHPFVGVGVRIEDDVLVTDDGAEILSGGIPSDPEGVAALVGSKARGRT